METQNTSPEQKEVKTHWKKLTNPLYIGSHDIEPGSELKIIFDTVSKEMVKGPDGKQEECIVAKLSNAKKPLILNKTNCKIIAKVLETPYIEQWKGRAVLMYVAKVKAFGEVVDAIRIKNQKID
jgi:hypothetical protein